MLIRYTFENIKTKNTEMLTQNLCLGRIQFSPSLGTVGPA